MLVVNVHMQAAAGKEADLKQTLLGLVAPTRIESGCIQYDLHFDPKDAGKFMFYEIWTSREALDRHLESPHLKAFRARMPELLATPLALGLWEKAT